MSEIDDLKKLVAEDWQAFDSVGSDVQGFTVVAVVEEDEGRWHMWTRVVVRAPSKPQHFYGFTFGRALTEYQEHEEPDLSYVVPMRPKVESIVSWVNA